MRKRSLKGLVSLALAGLMTFSLVGCGGSGSSGKSEKKAVVSDKIPTIDKINLGKDYQDVKATIKVLTNRTDIVDTVYKGYAEEFMKLYPNIKVEYEGVTDYEESLNLRLSTGDWGDLCFIPTSVNKNELSQYFTKLGDYDTLDGIYNYCSEKSYDGSTYGIANGGTANGIVYNKKVWKEAGITEMPKTPDEYIKDLKMIKQKTKAVPMYTNFAAGWPMGAWDAYIDISATGDVDFKNNMPHMKDPFSKRKDMTGPYAVYYTMYQAISQKLVEDDPASSDWESSKTMLNNGEIASMVLGSWAVAQCQDAGDTPDDVGYMPFPISINGKQYSGTSGNYAFGINNKESEDHQIAAMVYLKWLIEKSSIYTDEGSIPALKSQPLPDVLKDFDGVELLTNNQAPKGEEDLFDEVNKESEVGINNDDYPDCEIAEAAMYGSSSFDDLMKQWNEKWSNAQESLGVEVNQ